MDNGFYTTLVEGSPNHAGLIIIEDTRIRGRDEEFLYSGTISGAGDEVVANLRFRSYQRYEDGFMHITERDFELSLTGERTDDGFRVTGYSPSGREMIIHGKRLGAIDFSD